MRIGVGVRKERMMSIAKRKSMAKSMASETICSASVKKQRSSGSTQPPKIPPRHTMTIKWSGQGFDYEHNRGYDIDNQLYRDQSISTRAPTTGQVMLQVLERPQLDQKAWQSDLQRMVCTNWTFTSRINGFVNNLFELIMDEFLCPNGSS